MITLLVWCDVMLTLLGVGLFLPSVPASGEEAEDEETAAGDRPGDASGRALWWGKPRTTATSRITSRERARKVRDRGMYRIGPVRVHGVGLSWWP